MPSYVYAVDAGETRDPMKVGDKAANLARLDGIPGAACPPFFVVGAEACRAHLRSEAVAGPLAAARADIEADPSRTAEAAAAARAAIAGAAIAEDLARHIRAALIGLAGPDAFVAVRSSALGEDSAASSFAGQLDSFLFLRGGDAVLDAVLRCWASAFSERAVVYRRARGRPAGGVAVAAIVQRMIAAEASGVVFTADPVSGCRDELVVNATWGLGEGVVQGMFVTDTWRLRKDGDGVRAEIREKDRLVVFDRANGGGTRDVPVEAEKAGLPCLDAAAIPMVRAAALAVERVFGVPQDIEFAWADRTLYLLQSRPITTLPAGPEDGPMRVWDNSNIIESYAGVTAPLTFSFIRRSYATVYDQFLEIMGVPARVRARNAELFDTLLGRIRGQVYYNLRSWYALLRFFPGYRLNREFMESMMGVRERWAEDGDDPGSLARRICVEGPRLLLVALRMVAHAFTTDRRMRRFLSDFNARHARLRALPLETMPPHELIGVYREMQEQVLRRWKPPILSDFFAMIFYGVLRRLIGRWGLDPAGSLQNDLLCGDESIESSDAPRELMALALRLRADPAEAERFRRETPADLAAAWRAGRLPPFFRDAFDRYLERFGDRGIGELKLEEPKPREDPAFLFAVLKNYVAAETAPDPEVMAAGQRTRRADAETRAMTVLCRRRGPRGLVRAAAFRLVLREARRHVRNRENQRLARTRAFGLVRRVFLGIGDYLAKEGVLRAAGDVFYLTVEEVFDFVSGAAVTLDLQALADLRRAECDGWRAGPAPASRLRTYGAVPVRNPFEARVEAPAPDAAAEDGVLRGTPCCGGVVAGPVRVILSPSDDLRLDGEILVAEKTDPGWIPLYPSISGLLIERGSVLSHSAIVAREMGKPAIVGIPGLTAALKDGDRVEMDGAAGTVRPV